MSQDNLGLVGRYKVIVRKKSGKVLFREGRNLITSNGKFGAADRYITAAPTYNRPTHFAFGTDATVATVSDTALGAEIAAPPRTAFTPLRLGKQQVCYVTGITHSGADITIQEIGVFDTVTPSSGVLAARFLPQAFTLGNGDSFDITWTLELG